MGQHPASVTLADIIPYLLSAFLVSLSGEKAKSGLSVFFLRARGT
jgi:hypothetical protein